MKRFGLTFVVLAIALAGVVLTPPVGSGAQEVLRARISPQRVSPTGKPLLESIDVCLRGASSPQINVVVRAPSGAVVIDQWHRTGLPEPGVIVRSDGSWSVQLQLRGDDGRPTGASFPMPGIYRVEVDCVTTYSPQVRIPYNDLSFEVVGSAPATTHVAGDWDGNGTATPGVVRPSTWALRNANTAGAANIAFGYGRSTDRPVVGDWDGNGTVTPGIVRGNTWYLRNTNSAGAANIAFGYGRSTDRPVVGDWDGNGTVTPGIVRGNTWFLRNTNSAGPADVTFGFGRSTDRPVVGDWDGNGTVTPGIVRGTTWYLRNANSGGAANIAFAYGRSTDRPVVGDWDGNGTVTPGIVRGTTWFLRNTNSGGAADISLTYAA